MTAIGNSMNDCCGPCGFPRTRFSLGIVAAVSFLVLGILGVTGVLPAPVIGWTTVGVSGGLLLLDLAGRFRDRSLSAIIGIVGAITLLVLGVLGGTGVLAASQLGWGLIGTTAGMYALITLDKCCSDRPHKL